jgi:hypothetical protein
VNINKRKDRKVKILIKKAAISAAFEKNKIR